EHEAPARGVPDREREHSAQALRERVTPLLVRVDEHLRVAVGAEAVARTLELAAQVDVVVDLAVLDDVARAVLVRDRLVAVREVDDREPSRSEPDRAVEELTGAVRAAMDERGAHRREPVGPGVPGMTLPPQVVLVGVLPPLLYSGGFFTSLRDFRANLRPISLLALGLVAATMAGVGAVAHAAFGLAWGPAFVLGAIVAPTDP